MASFATEAEKKPLLSRSNSSSKISVVSYQSLSSSSPKGQQNAALRKGDWSQSVTLGWSDLNAYVKVSQGDVKKRLLDACCRTKGGKYDPISKHRRILKNVSGIARPGEVLAILGGSGAGKSTLLNILTRRNLAGVTLEGDVFVNGEKVKNRSNLRGLLAYVQQDDMFIGTMTVWEHLYFNAVLRMGDGYSRRECIHRVEQVINELGLTKCQDTIIGYPNRVKGISGGEKKRLAFASEVLTDPMLMIADEPTSGVDSFMAQQIMGVLKNMAAQEKTIVCTIHQPSSQLFALFDSVCLMADGRVVYLGPRKGAADFFERIGFPCPENYNPADHYMRILAILPRKEPECRAKIKALASAYQNSYLAKQNRSRVATVGDSTNSTELTEGIYRRTSKLKKYKANWCTQFATLSWRSTLTVIREPMLLKVRLFNTIVISILSGLIYWQTAVNRLTVQTINGILFQLVINMNFMFIFPVVETFCVELPVFLREHQSGIYRADAYYIAKIIAELPQYVLLPFIFTTIVYWMSGLFANFATYALCCVICILVANAAISFGYAISCISGDINIAMTLTPVIVIPLMLFGGFYINQNMIPVYFDWLKYASFFRYGFEALAVNEWSNIDNIPGCQLARNVSAMCPRTGDEVLDVYKFSKDWFVFDMIILLAMTFLVRTIGFLALLSRALAKR